MGGGCLVEDHAGARRLTPRIDDAGGADFSASWIAGPYRLSFAGQSASRSTVLLNGVATGNLAGQ